MRNSTDLTGRRRARVACSALTIAAFFTVGPLALVTRADVVDPSETIDGRTQLRQAELWWQTMFNLPEASNPILDATGDDALRAQVGSVLYLAGSFETSSERSITIEPGTTLFFPLLNFYLDNTGEIDPTATRPPFSVPYTDSVPDLLDLIAMPPSQVQSLFLEVDGVSVRSITELLGYRQVTDPNAPFTNVLSSPDNLSLYFKLDPTFGIGNPFDAASYPASIFPAVLDGYWVGLTPLAPGDHTIRFGGSANVGLTPPFLQILQNNLVHVRVIPEPRSLLLLGLGFVATGLLRSRRTA